MAPRLNDDRSSPRWPNWPSYGYCLGERIRAVRLMRRIPLDRLAELSGISARTIANIESNRYNNEDLSDPNLSTIYKIAQGLHVPPAVLLPNGTALVGDICPPLGDDPVECRLDWPASEQDSMSYSEAYVLLGNISDPPEFGEWEEDVEFDYWNFEDLED